MISARMVLDLGLQTLGAVVAQVGDRRRTSLAAHWALAGPPRRVRLAGMTGRINRGDNERRVVAGMTPQLGALAPVGMRLPSPMMTSGQVAVARRGLGMRHRGLRVVHWLVAVRVGGMNQPPLGVAAGITRLLSNPLRHGARLM